ncbi:MAG TPA: heparan-alpha-glucosaminide N-acetyltransferase domain-containing protein [Bacteroidota bacterium]|nr:heparan-alpha-glucosaminide N-acetyltransferase domain-containing protein [Bacteroidota bacterium]
MMQTPSIQQPKTRYVYIDLLRGWAVFVMIEVHVTNTFMRPEIRSEYWFPVLNFINGLVAPSFLFVAGYAFAIVGDRKWRDYLALSPVFWKQVGRIIQVWAVGYALHLPFFSFHKLAFLIGWDEWASFWPVDVLQCIALSLLLMLLVVLIARTQKRYLMLVTLLAALGAFITPFASSLNVDRWLSLPFASYVNSLHGSLFPIFPWMSFLLFGGVVGQSYVFARGRLGDERFFTLNAWLGLTLIVLSIGAWRLPVTLYPPHDFWVASPEFLFIRLGVVLMILSGLWFWERRMKSQRSLVSLLGSESLVTYTLHLVVIYGMLFGGNNLASIIGPHCNVLEVIGMSALLIAAMGVIAYAWNSLKKKSMLHARVLQYSILGVVLLVFFTKPY